MGEIFLKLLNLSITASWLILAVLCIRLIFRKIPKWITCLLWGVVAIRLIFPFSIESGFSLQPSAEPIRTSTMVEGELIPYVPSVDSNIGVVENTVNPLLVQYQYPNIFLPEQQYPLFLELHPRSHTQIHHHILQNQHLVNSFQEMK